MYRYHQETRDGLLDALRRFAGRTWLSHQAAEEFFRNRTSVIANSQRDFDVAESEFKVLEKAIQTAQEKLRSLRLVPNDVPEKLVTGTKNILQQARDAVSHAKQAHPDYFAKDDLLDAILALFEGSVGAAPPEDELEKLLNEGERRRKAKVPPGYRDGSKNETDRHGDFLLWSQVLAYAAEQSCPVILVTSERKDDWWEKHQGRRLGPRRELLDDAATRAGQRVVLYETERFVAESAERQGQQLDQKVFADIRLVGMTRQPQVQDGVDLEPIIEGALDTLSYHLLHADDVIAGLIAETNASDFVPDQYEVSEIGPLDLQDVSAPFEGSIHYTGEHDQDRMYHGNAILAHVVGKIRFDGTEWEIIDYEVTGEIEGMDYDPEDD